MDNNRKDERIQGNQGDNSGKNNSGKDLRKIETKQVKSDENPDEKDDGKWKFVNEGGMIFLPWLN